MGNGRVYNFSAGPAVLPESVLEKAASEMLNFGGSGMSVMEMSHRSKVYEQIHFETERNLRALMGIPEDYAVLFLQGGASGQFASVPMNLISATGKADYVVTGQFAGKAAKEAEKYGKINIAASSKDKNFTYIPKQSELKLDSEASYLHICENNTIFGTKWNYFPETGGVPVVSDMSSCILSEPVDVSKYALIYAGAQKNMGPAGLTVVILRRELAGKALPITPDIFDYAQQIKNDSLLNTPSTYSIYTCGLVLKWLIDLGGLSAMEKINREKAGLLYDCIDGSSLFSSAVEKECRSIMNVPFVTGSEELDAKFVKEAASAGFVNLKGHRAVGGMRASIYNAMPTEGIAALVEFMKKFEVENRV